eukprot:4088715-Alexandrium_andersonii.AAC.1
MVSPYPGVPGAELGLGQGVVELDARGAPEQAALGGEREAPRRDEAVPERDGLGVELAAYVNGLWLLSPGDAA